MPLVSGVCRTASAPMLSHGGSRLNASKPEAYPKTSCPKIKISFESVRETESLYVPLESAHRASFEQTTSPFSPGKTHFDKSNRISNECSIPLSRRRKVHEKFTRFFFPNRNPMCVSKEETQKHGAEEAGLVGQTTRSLWNGLVPR